MLTFKSSIEKAINNLDENKIPVFIFGKSNGIEQRKSHNGFIFG